MVLSANAETMKSDYKPVLETYVRKVDKLVHLTVNGEKIVTTVDHPFYVNGQGFVNAVDLCIGSQLIDNNGTILKVEQIFRESLHDETCDVYNFKVDEWHTYFVGDNKIYVHNNNYEDIPKTGKPGSASWKKAVRELKEARGKGNNYITETKPDAIKLLEEAKPYLKQSPTYDLNAPKSNFQIHPVEKGYNFDKPHIKFEDWSNGKQNGCNGHIFWENE